MVEPAASPPQDETDDERLRRFRRQEFEEAMERMLMEQEAEGAASSAGDDLDAGAGDIDIDDADEQLLVQALLGDNDNDDDNDANDDDGDDNNDNDFVQNQMDDDAALAALLADGRQRFAEQQRAPREGEEADGAGGAGQPHANNINNNANRNKKRSLSYTQSSFLAAAAAIFYALRTRQQWYLALVYLSSSKWAFLILGNAMIALHVKLFDIAVHVFLSGGLRLQEAEGLQDFFRWNITETCLALTMFRQELTVSRALQFLVLILAKCLHHVALLRQKHWRMTDDAVTPSHYNPQYPAIPWHHVKLLLLLILLQCLDLWAVQYMGQDLLDVGPSVSILFAFEGAILLVSAWSNILLWYLHVVDGLLHFSHDQGSYLGRVWLHTWKEHKATLTFAVELQAQAVQFLFYLTFFGFVLTYYGMPINLFREVYMSFAALKERLLAFMKYRKLMASMNRFANPTEEQLENAGRVCIICRDEMTRHDSKQLPVCQHIFHKSCLREWLTQQQSCPTCRSDIAAMEAQEAARVAAAAAADQRQGGNNAEPAAAENETAPPPDGVAAAAVAGDNVEQGLQQDSNMDSSSGITARRDKKVRFASSDGGTQHVDATQQPPTPPITLPALYRITKQPGAAVWTMATNSNNSDADNLYATTYMADVVNRMIATGVLVVVTDNQERRVNGGPMKEMLQIPGGGWVACNDAVPVCPLDGLFVDGIGTTSE
jgi:E3 ubiquitin-protein ligase synoviolin